LVSLMTDGVLGSDIVTEREPRQTKLFSLPENAISQANFPAIEAIFRPRVHPKTGPDSAKVSGSSFIRFRICLLPLF